MTRKVPRFEYVEEEVDIEVLEDLGCLVLNAAIARADMHGSSTIDIIKKEDGSYALKVPSNG